MRTLNEHTGYVYCLKLHANNHYLISGSEDKCFKVWNLNTGICENTIETDADVWKMDLVKINA